MSEAVIEPLGETADRRSSKSVTRWDTDPANGCSGNPVNRCTGDWTEHFMGDCVDARLGGSAHSSFWEPALERSGTWV